MKMIPTITQMMITTTASTIIRITAHCGSASEVGADTGFTGGGGGVGGEAGRAERIRRIINKKGCVQILQSHTHSDEQIKLRP